MGKMFLTREELFELTERKQAAAQRRWLTLMGYRFEVGPSGRPKVLQEAVTERLSGTNKSHRLSGPNLAAVDALR
jgi:hypothetical protein